MQLLTLFSTDLHV